VHQIAVQVVFVIDVVDKGIASVGDQGVVGVVVLQPITKTCAVGQRDGFK
jgi:hypothetical protein